MKKGVAKTLDFLAMYGTVGFNGILLIGCILIGKWSIDNAKEEIDNFFRRH